MTRPILSPLAPIFNPDIQWGVTAIGTTLGSIGAAASPGIVTATVSTLTPTVAVESAEFVDDFNRSDNGDINASSGHSWTWTDDANLSIVSNTLHSNSNFEKYVGVTTAVSSANQWAEVDVVSNPDLAAVCICARQTSAVNANNLYMFRYMGTVGGHPTPEEWEVYKKVGGTFTLLSSQAETQPSTPFTIRIEVDGTSVRGYRVSGGVKTLKCTGTLDGSITGSTVSILLQCFSLGDAVADNFRAGPL